MDLDKITIHYCPICKSKTTSFLHPRTHVKFHECPLCECIAKDDSHYVTLDEEKAIYELHQNSEDNIGYVNYLTNFIEQAVIPYIQSGKALDYGSGPNPVLKGILERYGFSCDIYDYFYAPDKVYENNTYDLITSTEVVEHLQDPLDMFQLCYEHLKSGGYLSIMTLFYPKDRPTFFDWFYIRDRSHVTFYSPKTMIYIAQKIGFEMVDHNDHRITVFKKP